MKKRVFYILNIFLILSFQLLALNFTENKKIEEIFEKNKLEGTFVLYDVQNNSFTGYNKKRAEV
ncbi:MAG: hypothetical protein ACRC0V_08030, partial [Fusobacteriaceae bacterium]